MAAKILFKNHYMDETFDNIRISTVYHVGGVDSEAAALDTSGIPKINEEFTDQLPSSRYYKSGQSGFIICTGRKAERIPGVSGNGISGSKLSPGYLISITWADKDRGKGSDIAKPNINSLLSAGKSSLYEKEKAYDADNKEIKVTYKAPGEAIGKAENFAAKIFLPRLTKTFNTIDFSGDPTSKAQDLVGYVNSGHTWMCVDFSWQQRNDNAFSVAVTFGYDEDGWDPVVVFKDSDNKIPADILIGNLAGSRNIGVEINGAKRPKMYKIWSGLPYGITL